MSKQSNGNETRKKILKNVGVGLLIILVAGVGMYLGMSYRSMQASQSSEYVQGEGPSSKLQVGSLFPDLELMTADSGRVRTGDFVANDGSVFIFMETGCPPCETMTQKWQELINSGDIAREQVVGISIEAPTHVANYAKKRGLTFPIYADTGMVFLRDYGVMEYPLVVVVGKSGAVRMYTYDARVSFVADALKKQMAN
ncbi:MAG: TlpA disulfide reductase family protein [Candidatus Zixiibacteriota bacterium]